MSIESSQNDISVDISADAVIDRLREALNVQSDTELAQALELNKSTVSTWRSRQRIPFPEVVKIALTTRESIDWILTGRERTEPVLGVYDGPIDLMLLSAAMYDVADSKIYKLPEEQGKPEWEIMRWKAKVIAQRYNHFLFLRDDFTKAGRMSLDKFYEHLMETLGVAEATTHRS